MKEAEAKEVNIHLPVDFICGDKFDENCNIMEATVESGIEEGWGGYDIGPKSIIEFSKVIESSKTIVWNGPPGVFEKTPFKKASVAFAQKLIHIT